MKNIISKLLAIVLAVSATFSSHAEITVFGKKYIGPMRAAKCVFAPDKYNCSSGEKKEARRWLIGASIAAVAAAAAAIGIAVTARNIQAGKIDAGRQEITELAFSIDREGATPELINRYNQLAQAMGEDQLYDAMWLRLTDKTQLEGFRRQCRQNQPENIIALARRLKRGNIDISTSDFYRNLSKRMEPRELYFKLLRQCDVPAATLKPLQDMVEGVSGDN
jgi:hypothetical protein